MEPNIYRRSGWRKVENELCEACKIFPAVEVHHNVARANRGGDEEENLTDLCHECHKFAPNGMTEMRFYIEMGGRYGLLVRSGMIHMFDFLQKDGLINKDLLDKKINKTGGKFWNEMYSKVLKLYQKSFIQRNNREMKKQKLEFELQLKRDKIQNKYDNIK